LLVLGLNRASCLLGRCSSTWATLPALKLIWSLFLMTAFKLLKSKQVFLGLKTLNAKR
jgi:hypothetical protein